jgi:hypothetical protein
VTEDNEFIRTCIYCGSVEKLSDYFSPLVKWICQVCLNDMEEVGLEDELSLGHEGEE